MNACLIWVALEKNGTNRSCTKPHKTMWLHWPYRFVFLVCSFVYQVDCLWGHWMIRPAVLFWASLRCGTMCSSSPRAASGTLSKWAKSASYLCAFICIVIYSSRTCYYWNNIFIFGMQFLTLTQLSFPSGFKWSSDWYQCCINSNKGCCFRQMSC